MKHGQCVEKQLDKGCDPVVMDRGGAQQDPSAGALTPRCGAGPLCEESLSRFYGWLWGKELLVSLVCHKEGILVSMTHFRGGRGTRERGQR
jgi:hypothetical protein